MCLSRMGCHVAHFLLGCCSREREVAGGGHTAWAVVVLKWKVSLLTLVEQWFITLQYFIPSMPLFPDWLLLTWNWERSLAPGHIILFIIRTTWAKFYFMADYCVAPTWGTVIPVSFQNLASALLAQPWQAALVYFFLKQFKHIQSCSSLNEAWEQLISCLRMPAWLLANRHFFFVCLYICLFNRVSL